MTSTTATGHISNIMLRSTGISSGQHSPHTASAQRDGGETHRLCDGWTHQWRSKTHENGPNNQTQGAQEQ